MSERAEFHVRGQPLDGTPLHYTASGLDYVYLANGFHIEDDVDYGRIVIIDSVDDLHRAIGMYVICQQRKLAGKEFRFLRKQMGLKQKDLAGDLGVNEQTVANYEKGKNIPAMADRLMRMTFLVWITPPEARVDVIKRLVDGIQEGQNLKTASRHREVCSPIVEQWQPGGLECLT